MLDKIQFLHSIVERTAPWLSAATMATLPGKLAGSLKKSISMTIPEGYEDDGGFHFGIDPEVKKQS